MKNKFRAKYDPIREVWIIEKYELIYGWNKIYSKPYYSREETQLGH